MQSNSTGKFNTNKTTTGELILTTKIQKNTQMIYKLIQITNKMVNMGILNLHNFK